MSKSRLLHIRLSGLIGAFAFVLSSEFVAGGTELGSAIPAAQVAFDTARVFACILLFGVLGTILSTPSTSSSADSSRDSPRNWPWPTPGE